MHQRGAKNQGKVLSDYVSLINVLLLCVNFVFRFLTRTTVTDPVLADAFPQYLFSRITFIFKINHPLL